VVLNRPVRIDISGWHDLQSTLVIIILIHGIHILFLILLILILSLIGVIIIKPSLLVPPQLILTRNGFILNIIITASPGVTS
jgi:hypothetical protein